MICPKCNKSNNDSAKFCSGCGAKLEAVSQEPVQQIEKPATVCANCGKELKPGAKFCAFCGTKTEDAVKTEPETILPRPTDDNPTILLNAEDADDKTVLLDEVQQGMEDMASQFQPNSSIENPNITYQQAIQGMPPQETKKKGGSPIIIVLVAVSAFLLMIAIVVSVIFFVPGIKEKIPFLGTKVSSEKEDDDKKDASGKEDDAEGEEDAEGTEGEEEAEKELPEEELDALNEQIEEAKAAFDEELYVGEEGCRPMLEAVITRCVELAGEYGTENSDLNDIAEEAFDIYVDAVFAQVDLLFDQDVRPELYEQMKSDLNAGLEQADKLAVAGFSVKKDKLEERLEELEDSYSDRYIARFNQFTELETWSRTESWDLMSDAESIGLVDYGDMDSPMTQRYAYALARVTIKTVETGLNDGSMSLEDAIAEIESVMVDTDYNLFLMDYLVYYMGEAGDDEGAEEVSIWRDDIREKIYETQGIDVGYDIELDYFWCFNEFEEKYSVDDVNGLTKSNHEWIREYMKDKF